MFYLVLFYHVLFYHIVLFYHVLFQVPLYDMKEQMKKLSIRTEHVLKRESQLEQDVDYMNAQLQVMEEKLLTLFKLIQKGKRAPLKTATSMPAHTETTDPFPY